MKLVAILLSLGVLAGCASHNTVQAPDLNYNLKAQEQRIEQDGVLYMAKAIHKKEEVEQYFGKDLLKNGVLPVQVFMQNKSHNGTFLYDSSRTQLKTSDGQALQVLPLNDVYEEAKTSMGQAVLWGAGFGLIGAAASAYNISETNDKIKADLDNKMLKNGALSQGASTQGFLFFNVPKDLASLNGWKLNLTLKDPEHLTTVLNQEFSDTVDPRKKIPAYIQKKMAKKAQKEAEAKNKLEAKANAKAETKAVTNGKVEAKAKTDT